ncbi:MAG TPA: type I-E CRISPR-associated protein Cas6/Cse3/CasE, partial [Candidatus Hydrogenedentes bacterium]|nr:type I-E CRISPR-associated protein Cas6/Cse3/CasE [Candidatus Hydrogenedentota bacterium]
LLINTGSDPDRPRPGRLWLRNIYQVHQRLCMGFPSAERVKDDPHFLKPYRPEDFPEDRCRATQNKNEAGEEALKHVHARRDSQSGFLFRIDPQAGGSPVIVVSSALQPNWDYAFQNADMLLAARPLVREYDPAFPKGAELRFRILMNLSKKSMEHRRTLDKKDAQGRSRSQGKRVALTWREDQQPQEVIVPWFAEKAAPGGFCICECALSRLGWVAGYPPGKKPLKFRWALLEGRLEVTDTARFAHTLASGIGSAKAFGFGLLTVGPLRRE